MHLTVVVFAASRILLRFIVIVFIAVRTWFCPNVAVVVANMTRLPLIITVVAAARSWLLFIVRNCF